MRRLPMVLAMLVVPGVWAAGPKLRTPKPLDAAGVKLLQQAAEAYAQGKQDRQISLLRQLVRTHPDSPRARRELAQTLFNAHKDVEALEQARAGAAFTGEMRPELLVLEGKILNMMGHFQEAQDPLLEALRLDPRRADGHAQLAVALMRTGHMPGAKESAVKALALDPGKAEYHRILGLVLANSGEKIPAILALAASNLLDPRSRDARGSLEAIQGMMLWMQHQGKGQTMSLSFGGSSGGFMGLDMLWPAHVAAHPPEPLDGESVKNHLEDFHALLDMMNPLKARKDFVGRTYLPLFQSLYRKKLDEAAFYVIHSANRSPAVAAWLKAHADRVKALQDYLGRYAWPGEAALSETAGGGSPRKPAAP